jgi:hypothetical protein
MGGLLFGYYDIPFRIIEEGISLSIDKEGENLLYRREYGVENVEKILLGSNGKVLINPIEPVTKPKELTPYLLIDLDRALVVEPKGTKKIFVTFPIEIGVFIRKGEDSTILDTFTLMKQKFTLYGDPRSGFICRYFKSNVYSVIPSVDRVYEGVMELNITNTTTGWIEVTKAMFNAYGMKIYYSDNLVSMRANMKVKSSQIAENDFDDSPLEAEMNKSVELFSTRKLSITTTKSIMELGI